MNSVQVDFSGEQKELNRHFYLLLHLLFLKQLQMNNHGIVVWLSNLLGGKAEMLPPLIRGLRLS